MKFVLVVALIAYTLAASGVILDESDTEGSCDLWLTAAAMNGVVGTETYTWYYGYAANAAADGWGGFVWEVESTDDCTDYSTCTSGIAFGWKVVAVDDATDDVTLSGGATTSCTFAAEQDVDTDLALSDACTFTLDSLSWPDAEDYYTSAADYGMEDSTDDIATATLNTVTDVDVVTFTVTGDASTGGDCYSAALGASTSINTAFAAAFAAISLF